MSPRRMSTVLALVFAGMALGCQGCRGCKASKQAPSVTFDGFTDAFERTDVGPSWRDTGGGYAIKDGRLNAHGAHNHPLWLKTRLTDDAVIELDATSMSPAGDIKVEVFGDGEAFDPDQGSYTSTGYVFIFGGWHNSLSIIARNHEHNEGVKAQRTEPKVEVGRRYHFTISRRGNALDWQIDGQPFLAWSDPDPLRGDGHGFFAFDNWESDVFFDNLVIRPLAP